MAKITKKIDKRTKEWKEIVSKQQETQSKGVGDTIEKITEATGIKKAVKAVFGDDCGCNERKQYLNSILPYNVTECLEEQEYNYLINFFATKRFILEADEQNRLLEINNRVFKEKHTFSNCGSCVRNLVRKLEKLFYEYNKFDK